MGLSWFQQDTELLFRDKRPNCKTCSPGVSRGENFDLQLLLEPKFAPPSGNQRTQTSPEGEYQGPFRDGGATVQEDPVLKLQISAVKTGPISTSAHLFPQPLKSLI